MECRRRVRAIDRDNIHPRQHLIEAVPEGRVQFFLDRPRDLLAIVIVNLQPKRLGAAGDGLANSAHANNAEALA